MVRLDQDNLGLDPRRALVSALQGGTATGPDAFTSGGGGLTGRGAPPLIADAPAAPAAVPAAAPGLRSREGIAGYFKSRGVTPYDGSIDYWAGKAQDPAFADDKYFQDRLSQADEFSNKGPHWDWTKGQGAATAPMGPAGGLSALLQGNAGGNIGAALGKMDTSPSLIQQLIASLKGAA